MYRNAKGVIMVMGVQCFHMALELQELVTGYIHRTFGTAECLVVKEFARVLGLKNKNFRLRMKVHSN